MTIENEQIQTIEQAKRYFKAMGCSHFHLDRENFQRRDEYYALNVSSELENKWRQEEVEEVFDKIKFAELEKIAHYYSYLKSIITRDNNHLNRMLNLANDLIYIVPVDKIHILLSVIIGNNASLTHGGLIEDACKIGLNDLAQRFISCAKTYIEKSEENNISILWLRGYLVDVIVTLGLMETDSYLYKLREKDNIENFKYYHQGANEGNIFSMRMLAKHYIEGKGCEIDRTKAIYWLTQAASSGNNLAKKELSELQKY